MIHSLCPLFFVEAGLEPIAVELSGGHLLPPVQTLVATSISFPPQGNEMQIESGHRHFVTVNS
jgi:hypothetical protein